MPDVSPIICASRVFIAYREVSQLTTRWRLRWLDDAWCVAYYMGKQGIHSLRSSVSNCHQVEILVMGWWLLLFQCWGSLCPKHKVALSFEGHWNPVMLVSLGSSLLVPTLSHFSCFLHYLVLAKLAACRLRGECTSVVFWALGNGGVNCQWFTSMTGLIGNMGSPDLVLHLLTR